MVPGGPIDGVYPALAPGTCVYCGSLFFAPGAAALRSQSSRAASPNPLRDAASYHAHVPRRSEPYGSGRQDAAAHRYPKSDPVHSSEVVQNSQHPRTQGSADPRSHTERAKNRSIVAPVEDLRGNGAVDRGESVADEALRHNHHIKPTPHGPRMHHQKGRVREYEPGAAKTPGPL